MKRRITILLLISLFLSGCGRKDPRDITMTETPRSTAISAVGYEDGTLVVTFRVNQRTYAYFDVPHSKWRELLTADSMGEYVVHHIKYEYDYQEITAETDKAA